MKKYSPFFITRLLFIAIFLVFFSSACEKDEEEKPLVNQEFESFYQELKEWYYWNDQIPEIDPSSYNSLADILEAVRYQERDRWSFVTEWDEFWAYLNNSEFIGYGFGSKFDAAGNLRVTFVYNTVAMYDAGVRRSWIVEAINGVPITPQTNINSLLGAEQVGVSNTFRFLKPDGGTEEFTFIKENIVMNTVLHHEVIEQDNIKVGYMVLQQFTGTTSEEIKAVFENFSEQQVSELILDMRYNGGGLTSVARELASLIAGPGYDGEAFTKYEYNQNKSQYNKMDTLSTEPNSLSLNRLVTICTESTASASELVINGLRPYLDVHIVGANTYGKPMGANVFRFNTNWAMVPITFKTNNANDEGDYFDGLSVDIPANDGLDREFGHPEEASLQQALAFIGIGSAKTQELTTIPYKQPLEGEWNLRRMIGAW